MIAGMRVLRTATARGERWALAAVALFGLMSMHGWGSHSAQPVPVTAAPVAHLHAADPAVVPAGTSTAPIHEPGSPALGHNDGSGGHGDHGGLVELCLAILVGLVLTALLWVGHRGVLVLPAWLPTWPVPALTGRDRDPPDLLRLCVVRC